MQEIPAPPLPPDVFVPGADPMQIAIAVVVVVGAVGALAIAWQLVRALLRKWSVPPPSESPTLQDLQQAVQQLGSEVADMQERLDFAERVLASHKDVERIPRGGD